MREFATRRHPEKMRLAALCPLLVLIAVSQVAVPQAFAAESPFELSAELSLTGGCGTSKVDPIPDPGCPETKPPKAFTKPQGIAIDSFGNEYVANYGGEEGKLGRIDVFSPKGIFITEVKDEGGPKTVAVDGNGNLYVFEQRPGSESMVTRYSPTVYKPAEEKIEYGNSGETVISEPGPSTAGIAIDSNNHVFVDWEISIKELSSAEEDNKLLSTITNKALSSSVFIAFDKQRRRLYASSCPTGDIEKCWVLVFDADTHELMKEVEGPNPPGERFVSRKGWISIAVDEQTGDFFVGDLELSANVYQFNEKYELISTLEQKPALFEGGEPLQIAVGNAEGAFNAHYLFVPSLKNRALAYSPPKEQEPVIVSISAAGISENEAELQAVVKPRGGVTTYRIEYLTQQEYEKAGSSFFGALVAGEGTIQPNEQEAEVQAAIDGLQSETAYRLRVVAENSAGEDEAEATFTTYNDAPIASRCPEAIRSTYSMLLPDCRAYELVTPADTNGRPPRGIGFVGDRFSTIEDSPDGSAVSFLTEGGVIPGLGGTGSLNGDLYRTIRTTNGWSTESAGPEGEETTSANEGGVSSDQGYSFWVATREGSAVIGGEATHYVRYPDGHSELVGRGSLGIDPRAAGFRVTPGGAHIVFQTRVSNGSQPIQLEPDAPPTGTGVVYDRTANEVTHVISLLPGDETPEAGEDAGYAGASADGEGIAFRIGTTLYLRLHNETTYEIGKGVEFAGISEEGKRIFYLEGGDLFAFDAETEEAIPFTTTGNTVLVNISMDGGRAYFVSTTPIEGSGENPNGASAEAGKQNLYLSEEGQIRFVATVTERDVNGELRAEGQGDGLGLWTDAIQSGRIAKDPSRTNPEGTVLLFSSRANLDGYDSEGAPQIYRYDSAADRLRCISCIPTKAPATGGASLQSLAQVQGSPEPFTSFGFVPNLRADGKRAVFQSTEALVSRDNDEVQDVYEWEEQGIGSCTRDGGCVYLISSGHSERNNYLYGVSASGNDVFFTTSDVLATEDDSTVSIYDARVNGGFVESIPDLCQKLDKCMGPANPPPALPVPTSEGLGRLEEEPPSREAPKKCPKGKVRVKRGGKRLCVKRKHHHRKHHASKKGRVGK